MAVKTVLLFGNKLLRAKSELFDFNREDPSELLADMKDTLHVLQKEKGIGRALAAPQIGFLKRVIYAETGDREISMINPLLLARSSDYFEVWDSCFSADVAFFGKVCRHRKIAVSYFNENGERLVEEMDDDISELFQHEIDHLNGILFIDRIIENNIIMRSEWEKIQVQSKNDS